jgi:large subunit ribosomal protein L23
MMNERIFKILLSPLLSEKSSLVNKSNHYVFKVIKDATKPEIKMAVEKIFKVKVVSVQVVNSKPRRVQFRRIAGLHKAWKKAYVRLASGDQIDFISMQA